MYITSDVKYTADVTDKRMLGRKEGTKWSLIEMVLHPQTILFLRLTLRFCVIYNKVIPISKTKSFLSAQSPAYSYIPPPSSPLPYFISGIPLPSPSPLQFSLDPPSPFIYLRTSFPSIPIDQLTHHPFSIPPTLPHPSPTSCLPFILLLFLIPHPSCLPFVLLLFLIPPRMPPFLSSILRLFLLSTPYLLHTSSYKPPSIPPTFLLLFLLIPSSQPKVSCIYIICMKARGSVSYDRKNLFVGPRTDSFMYSSSLSVKIKKCM